MSKITGAVLLSSTEENLPRWSEELLKTAPDLDLRVAPNVGREEDIEFAIVARPPLGYLGRFTQLKAIFSMWAGVAELLADQSIAHLPLYRMTEPGLTIGVVNYVVHHVTGLHIQTAEYKTRLWSHPFRDEYHPPQDTCVGILGLGALGTACATALRQLEFTVIGYSHTRKNLPGVRSYAGRNELQAFLERTDILVCLLPTTPDTENFMNQETLAQLPSGAKIVNCGRGESIDDQALLEALRTRHISRAVLDVFRIEPLPPEHPYWDEPNVLVTPHCASKPNPRSASTVILNNINKFLNEEPIDGLVDRKRAY